MQHKRISTIVLMTLGLSFAGCSSEQREDTDGTTNAGTTEGTEPRTGGAADAMDGTVDTTDARRIRSGRDTIIR